MSEVRVPQRACPKARRGQKRKEHGPHDWTSGDEHVGDDIYDFRCPGWPAREARR